MDSRVAFSIQAVRTDLRFGVLAEFPLTEPHEEKYAGQG